MDMFYLDKLAAVVLPEEASYELSKLLQDDDMNSAPVTEYLLDKVDRCYILGILSFEDTTAFYNQMDISPKRASMFPQKGC